MRKKHGPAHAGSGTAGAREMEKEKKGRKEKMTRRSRAESRRNECGNSRRHTSERSQNEQELDRAELE